jgi:hypothetical protein
MLPNCKYTDQFFDLEELGVGFLSGSAGTKNCFSRQLKSNFNVSLPSEKERKEELSRRKEKKGAVAKKRREARKGMQQKTSKKASNKARASRPAATKLFSLDERKATVLPPEVPKKVRDDFMSFHSWQDLMKNVSSAAINDECDSEECGSHQQYPTGYFHRHFTILR